MDLVNETALCLAPLVTMRRPGEYHLTVIVKGTFELRPEAAAVLAEPQLFPTGDEPYPDDPDAVGSLRYASDFAPAKPRADLLLVGTCHPPGGGAVTSCAVGFQVGRRTKTLSIVGDRRWVEAAGVRLVETAPEPFSEMPLRYERSYGGSGYPRNPVGLGHGDRADEEGRTYRPLPNIEASPGPGSGAGGQPAGFGPLAMTWQDRIAKARAGTYGKRWLTEQWPGFPDDFDWGFFNAAPADQQWDGYLVGDEELCFDNLHPQHAVYRSRLPGLRVRCFSSGGAGASGFAEIPLALDTLWVDMDTACLALVWRGRTLVDSLECDDIDHLYVVAEPLVEAPGAPEAYRAALARRLAQPTTGEGEPIDAADGDLAAEVEQAEAAFRVACAQAGLDPDHRPEADAETQRLTAQLLEQHGIRLPGSEPPLTREEVEARHLRGAELAGEDLRGLQLDEMKLSGAQLASALLGGVSLQGARLEQADLAEAELMEADLSAAALCGANLHGADLTGACLEDADLSGACLDGALLDGARCRGARFDGASAAGASFRGADLSGATLPGCTLCGADFTAAILDGASWVGADLSEASWVRAGGAGVDLSRTVLRGLRASAARLPQVRLEQSRAADSVWDKAVLTGADMRYACLDGSDFSQADLSGARLDAVSAKGARFYKTRLAAASARSANAFQGNFQGADLTGADFQGANLYGAEFLEACLLEIRLDGANLKMTKLQP